MKKSKKSATKLARKRTARPRKSAGTTKHAVQKRTRTRSTGSAARPQARSRPTSGSKTTGRLHTGTAAKFAASVLSRRAAKNEALAAATIAKPVAPAPVKPPAASHSKQQKAASRRPGRTHSGSSLPGNRPVVKVSRVPQYTYMRAPGADSGFDVGDSVEVFCDHEIDSERVRGWIKGVVVQVDNKLVAVQFRSNVFLTDGWMVPDRILWYALSSDQIRNTGVSKRGARAAIPEY